MRKIAYRSYFLPVCCALCFSMFINMLTDGIEFTNHSMVVKSMAFYSSQISGSGNILMIVCLLVAAPLCEEIIFRGLIQKWLLHDCSPVISVLISALLFGLMHLMAGGFLLCFFSIAIGLILGLTCIKTRSLFPAVAAHAAANFTDFIMLVIPSIGGFLRIGFALIFLFFSFLCFKKVTKISS